MTTTPMDLLELDIEVREESAQLRQFFEDQVKEIYTSGKLLVTVLSKMQNAASSPIHRDVFKNVTSVLFSQISRLEDIFALLNVRAESRKNSQIEDLINQVDVLINNTPGGSSSRDLDLILVTRKIEHYEIISYLGLIEMAYTLNCGRVAELMEKSYNENIGMDSVLMDLAQEQEDIN